MRLLRAIALLLSLAGTAFAQTRVEKVPQGDATGLLGRSVTDIEGQEIGHLVDILLGRDGHPRGIVAEIGGFMGMGTRRIAIAWPLVQVRHGADDWVIRVAAHGQDVAAAPEYTTEAEAVPLLSAAP